MPKPTTPRRAVSNATASKRVRLVYRDITPETLEVIGAEIDLASLAAWRPGQPASVFTGGFQLFQSWRLEDLSRQVHPNAENRDYFLREEIDQIGHEAAKELEKCLRNLDRTIPTRYVDDLHYCPLLRRWWTTPVSVPVRRIVFAVNRLDVDSARMIRDAGSETSRSFAGVGYCQRAQLIGLHPLGDYALPGGSIDPIRLRETTWGHMTGSDLGYWNLAHACMSVRDFLRAFASGDAELVQLAESTVRYVLSPAALSCPVARSRLLLDPAGWVRVWMQRGEPAVDQIDAMIDRLKKALRDAGLRPWSQSSPPLLPPDQRLNTLIPILTDEMIDADAVADLAAIGVHTLEDLRKASLATLHERFSPLQSDLLRAVHTVRAFGHDMALKPSFTKNHMKLKRTIHYTTDDGKSFDTRAAATAHEICLKRRSRLESILKSAPGFDDTLNAESRDAILSTILGKWTQIVALSDRTIRRELRDAAKHRKPRRRDRAP